MITIDDTVYNAEWKSNSLEVTADIINGDESGRLQGTKSMYLDFVGTFFNTTGEIVRARECSNDEWSSLFRALSNPVNRHTVEIPFLQGVLRTSVYISRVKAKLIGRRFGENKWTGSYSVTYTAIDSQWLAGQDIQGYIRS